MKVTTIFCIYLTSFFNLYCQTVNGSNTYKAAVVEYHTEDVDAKISADEKIILRSKNHIELLKNIKEDLEIILFPEKSLYTDENIAIISSIIPKQMENICNSSDHLVKEYLKLFSCAASQYNTSIAINVIEREQCLEGIDHSCSDTVYYNTVVVFDHKGYLVGRYRKWNLFGEFQLSKPKYMDLTVITSKNNISFGIFNCFDIIFDTPPLNLTRDFKIKNILFPNNWISELPYLTAFQVQQMWAHENDVVLLSAGGNDPKSGASGTGIYVGKQGHLENVFIGGDGGSSVIVKTVPNLENEGSFDSTITPQEYEDTDTLAETLDSFFLLRDLSLDDYTSILMDEQKIRIVEEVCSGNTIKICCNFDISIKVNETIRNKYQYKYHLAAFSGIRSFSGLRNAGVESCGIIACLNASLSTCALRFSNYSEIFWPITFDSISIEANFPADNNRIQYPSSLRSSLRPIPAGFTSWEKEDLPGFVKRRFVLNKPENRLLTFGIFGRNFNSDGELIKPNGESEVYRVTVLIIILFNILLILI